MAAVSSSSRDAAPGELGTDSGSSPGAVDRDRNNGGGGGAVVGNGIVGGGGGFGSFSREASPVHSGGVGKSQHSGGSGGGGDRPPTMDRPVRLGSSRSTPERLTLGTTPLQPVDGDGGVGDDDVLMGLADVPPPHALHPHQPQPLPLPPAPPAPTMEATGAAQ